MKKDTIEKSLGRKFSDAQKRLLKFDAHVDANRDWLEILFGDPERLKICKTIATSKKE